MTFHRVSRACATLAITALLASRPAPAQTAPASQVAAPAESRAAALQAVADAWVARTGVPGVTLAAIDKKGELVKVASGFSRISTKAPMKPDDRMFSGSIGKTYFAAVALQLVAEGTLNLDDKISAVAGKEPWFAGLPNAEDLTLRMLLNHTSGIDEHVQSKEFIAALKAEPMKHWNFGELLKTFTCGKPALFPAGTSWSYADTNYIVAGLVIEKAVGKPMYTLIRERILTPKKLADTIPSEGPTIPGLITGYEGPAKMFTDAEEFAVDGKCVLNPQFEWCGGGFACTSPDLARWGRLLWGGDEIVSAGMKKEMLKGIAQKRTGPNDEYGLGVIIWKSPLGRALGHTGMFPGYVSQVFHFPDSGVTVAMQTNSMDFSKMKGLRALIIDAAKAAGAEPAAEKEPGR